MSLAYRIMYTAMSDGELGGPGSRHEEGLDVPGGEEEAGQKEVPEEVVDDRVFPQHGDESALDRREEGQV